jgi:cell division protease FtsH
MSDKLGTVAMGHREELVFLGRDLGEQRNYSEEVAAIIDEEIRSIVSRGYEAAKHVLTGQKDKLDTIARHLIKVETIDGPELERLLHESPEAIGAVA